ncbi:MAG: hypothetical protein JW795_16795, partial [Chitinivibrionales bacterium]|nr:hypothetical protein [Chitinivibrionales bacterium]
MTRYHRASALLISIMLFWFLNTPVSGQFDSLTNYPNLTEYKALLSGFAKNFPSNCTILDIGKSVRGRSILVVAVSENIALKAPKPELVTTATMHGDENAGMVFSLQMINHLLKNFGTDPQCTRILKNYRLYFAPLCNPDGHYKNDTSVQVWLQRCNANGIDINQTFTIDTQFQQIETTAFKQFMANHNITFFLDIHCGVSPFLTYSNRFDGFALRGWENPDRKWWHEVLTNWIECADAVKPGCLKLQDTACPFITPPFGNVHVYSNFIHHSRGAQAELHGNKWVYSNQFSSLFTMNRQGFLDYIEQMGYGIRGFITDSVDGRPLVGRVFVENHDRDSSWVYSGAEFGDYYRP